MYGLGYFQNRRNFFGFFRDFGGNFWGIFLGNFFGGFFWEDFFWRIFLGGFLWEEFFGRNSTKSYLNIEGIDLLVKILVFVKILYLRKGRKEGRRKFKSLEVRLQVHRT